MSQVAYSVTATLPDEGLAREYIAWLVGGHVDQVIRGGAETGMVVRLEDSPGVIRVESCYTFATRDEYERYVRVAAPVLRAEGLRLFPPERGIRMERRLGSVLQSLSGEGRAAAVLQALREAGLTLSTAESCTGGMLGGAITAVAGSSAVYRGGWVTYANEMKVRELGVPEGLLAADGPGAVSREVAEAMATGGRLRSGADLCVSITGIAGPDGGSDDKPVGTVWIGLANRSGVGAALVRLGGDRAAIRNGAVNAAMDRVLRAANRG